MTKFAQNTKVPVERSRSEAEGVLTRYGADQVSSGWTAQKAVLMFRMKDRYIRIEMPLAVKHVTKNSKGYVLGEDATAKENRRRWRAMVLYLKAKLESVESEIISFEQAFMSHMILPNKQTVAEFMAPQIAAAYQSGDMPKQLPGY